MAKKASAKKTAGSATPRNKRAQKVTTDQITKALDETMGRVATAARQLGVTRQALTYRIAGELKIREALEDIRAYSLDRCELKLEEAIGNGEPWAIKFYLQTIGKDRGYVMRTETDHVVDGSAEIRLQLPTIEEMRSQPGWVDYCRQSLLQEAAGQKPIGHG